MSLGKDQSAVLNYFFPFLRWLPSLTWSGQRTELEAGLIGAVLVLPQSIALAALAGMPPEYGIYTSIIPVIIAALWGSSPQAVSGPNTAVCVLIALSVAPLAALGTEAYITLVLALTLMVGCIQLCLGLFRMGAILDFISDTVIVAIIHGVALVMIAAALPSFLGTPSYPDQPFIMRLYLTLIDLPQTNPQALIVSLVTLFTGIVAKMYWRSYALVLAVFVGSVTALILKAWQLPIGEPVQVLGALSLNLLPLSLPISNQIDFQNIRDLMPSAFSIAVLGLMQSIVIARSLATRDNIHTDTNQEIVAQGLANTTGAFFSSFAGSGSFNRSAANYDAGARTPMAAVYASLLLGLMVFVGAGLLASIAIPAVAGLLILVSINLFDFKKIKRIFRTRTEGFVLVCTLAFALGIGLNAGILVGILVSLTIYLWNASTPNVRLEENISRDGRPVLIATIDGNLFFGSVQYVKRVFSELKPSEDGAHILLMRTDHLTYLDVSGAELIGAEARRRRQDGNEFYIYVTRDAVQTTLTKAGVLEEIGEDNVLHRDMDHPIKKLMYPAATGATKVNLQSRKNTGPREINVSALVKRLRSTRLIGPLSSDQLTTLLEGAALRQATAGDVIVKQDEKIHNHIILVDGQLETQREWTTPEGVDHSNTKVLEPGDMEGAFAYIGAASKNLRVRALTDVQFFSINADIVDDLLGWTQQLAAQADLDPETRRRMELVKQVSIFQQLPFENVKKAFERMRSVAVAAGQSVVTQGDEGDSYYLMESGEAEVIKTDPFTDETNVVAKLSPGDAFGEEALLQGGYRNATIKMTSPGQLLTLDKLNFDDLVKSSLVSEVTSEQAKSMLDNDDAKLVDCRYDMEYEDSRIPGAIFIPLDRVRWDIHKLNPEEKYVVYCRSGRRSKAAAFLLQERNIVAVSLIGGIKDWPFDLELEPIELGA